MQASLDANHGEEWGGWKESGAAGKRLNVPESSHSPLNSSDSNAGAAAGSVILLLTGSPGATSASTRTRIASTWSEVSRHVSFGYGTHFCLGASPRAWRRGGSWRRRLSRREVDWSGAERVTTSTVRGFAKLPIRF